MIPYDYSVSAGIKHIDDSGHHYPTPFGILPSITTVNSAIADKAFLKRWRDRIGDQEADRISFESSDRGSLVHAYLEARYNVDPTDPDTMVAPNLVWRELAAKYGDVGVEMAERLWELSSSGCRSYWAQEIALWSGELMVAGRCDMIGEWNGVPSIIDFKTSRRWKSEQWIEDYKYQVTAYGMMHDEMFGSDLRQGVILIAVERARPQVFVFDMEPWRERVRERCVDYYRLQWAKAA